MKAYQRYSKAYSLIDSNGQKMGEYTTIDGAHTAAKRRGLTDYTITPNYG